MRKLLLALCLAAAGGGFALGAEVTVNEHRDVAPDGLIQINMIAGTLQVSGWDKAEIEVTGTLSDEALQLRITGGKDRTKIEVHYPDEGDDDGDGGDKAQTQGGGHGRHSGGHSHTNHWVSDLVIRVPRKSRIEADTVSAPITVADLSERVELNSVSGELEVKGSPREVKLSTVSGNIMLRDGKSLENAQANSVSGTLRTQANLRSGGSFKFETVSGDVELKLPASSGCDFKVSTFSGKISNDFGAKVEKTSSYLPSQELSFTVGSGGARVSVQSFSGSIRILKE
jgi:DUF4097 and DUF4098 domain-containing protein YvlB